MPSNKKSKSKRILQAEKERKAFLERLAIINQNIPITEEEFLLWENSEEEYVVPLIKKYLRTDAQKLWLFVEDLSIEDMLNGRFDQTQEVMVKLYFKEWNQKLGTKHFLED
jgi:hypothetical protein